MVATRAASLAFASGQFRLEWSVAPDHSPGNCPLARRTGAGRVGVRRVGVRRAGEPAAGMSRAVLSIGSNIPDRLANLQLAVDGLADQLVAVSPVFQTPPWGPVAQE